MSEPLIAATILGESAAIREVRALISKIASKNLPVLIQGPTGSGKELVAQALHDASGRPGKFVAFNVCAITESMFEDALFGHVRGAFTGATESSDGFFVEAHRGTLFLDEISGLALPLQAKLLRVLETGSIRPIGGRTDLFRDFRIIAATNESMSGLIGAGRFRADLAFRLRGITITLPAMSNRREDIPFLARHFVRAQIAADGPIELTRDAIQALTEREWPGNVREIKHVIECAIALSDTRILGRAEIERASPAEKLPITSVNAGDFEKRRLIEVLMECGGRRSEAATRLGIERTTLWRRMRRLKIALPEHRNEAAGVAARCATVAGDWRNVQRLERNP